MKYNIRQTANRLNISVKTLTTFLKKRGIISKDILGVWVVSTKWINEKKAEIKEIKLLTKEGKEYIKKQTLFTQAGIQWIRYNYKN